MCEDVTWTPSGGSVEARTAVVYIRVPCRVPRMLRWILRHDGEHYRFIGYADLGKSSEMFKL